MLFIDIPTLQRRVTNAVLEGTKVVLLLGSGVSRSTTLGGLGVPMSAEIVETVRSMLPDKKIESYTDAFDLLIKNFSADRANEVVRCAVLKAYRFSSAVDVKDDNVLEHLEEDPRGWHSPDGLKALATLIRMHPKIFGRTILTTNFDPLIEMNLSMASQNWYGLYLHGDGSLQRARGNGTGVVHLHGHWIGSDTLHTERQLMQDRPMLVSSLLSLLGQRAMLIVLGYGGWTDVAVDAISQAIASDQLRYDIV